MGKITSPLNVACIIYLVVIIHAGIQFNRHGGENATVDKIALANGDGTSLVESASARVPFMLDYRIKQTGESPKLRCKALDFANGEFILRTHFIEYSQNKTKLDDALNANTLAYELYVRFVEYTGMTDQNTQKSKILDALIDGRVPVRLRLEADNNIDEKSHILDEKLFAIEEFLPMWQNLGLKSALKVAEKADENSIDWTHAN